VDVSPNEQAALVRMERSQGLAASPGWLKLDKLPGIYLEQPPLVQVRTEGFSNASRPTGTERGVTGKSMLLFMIRSQRPPKVSMSRPYIS